ncbi:hypothetical protein HMPREF0972_00088 [Actinomyces sp. oral taxon 848 str. F0332]|nr:hypothetical protein HMPREF0972_00088 [Actinomyces sp. oral taxon 848 str. F0332]
MLMALAYAFGRPFPHSEGRSAAFPAGSRPRHGPRPLIPSVGF